MFLNNLKGLALEDAVAARLVHDTIVSKKNALNK